MLEPCKTVMACIENEWIVEGCKELERENEKTMVVQQPGYHLQQEVVGVDMVQSHVTKRSVTKLLELHVQKKRFRVAWSMWHVICWQGQENGQKFYWMFWHQVWMWYEGLLWWWNLRNWYPHPKMNTLYCTEPGQGGRTIDCFRWSIENVLARRVCFVSLHCFNNFAGVISQVFVISTSGVLFGRVFLLLFYTWRCCCFIPEEASITLQ